MLSSTLAIALVYCLQFCCRHHLAFYFKMAKLRNDVDDDVIFFIIELGINFFFFQFVVVKKDQLPPLLKF